MFQLPVWSQVCALLLVQRVAPGTQLPVHAPAEQTDVHRVPVVGHFPVESQVSLVLPLHIVLTLGVQTAPHCPVAMVPLSQVPWLLHVCGVVPEQFMEPGAQTPLQAPLRHACPVQAAAAPQVPFVSQVCTPFPEHWVAPGLHTPVQAPFAQALPTQSLAAPQMPFASQVCTPLLEHWVLPGVQLPVHLPFTQAWLVHAFGVPQLPSVPQS